MTDTTEKTTRELTMKDFFREENGEVIPVDESVLIDFKDGDIVEGEVVRIDRDEVLVDIGYKSEGLVPSNELTIRKGADPHDVVDLGQRLEALVLQKEDADGRLILSAKRAAFERAWNRIEESYNEQRTVEGPVIEVVKGGLILDIGLRGFLPASLVDIRRVRNLESFSGRSSSARSSSSTGAATTWCSRAAPCSRRSARKSARRSSPRSKRARSSRAPSRTSWTSARSSTSRA
jgi:small subunit ribosomal protein S1